METAEFYRFSIPKKLGGERLDVVVASLVPGLSRSRARALIISGRVLLDGAEKEPSQKVRAGELLEVEVPRVEELRLRPEPVALDILYEDPYLLVLNKPAGMAVHPAETLKEGTLANALLAHIPQLEGVGEPLRPGIVHRLDKDTSGLMVVAKTEKDRQNLAARVKAREVARKYLALVWGDLERDSGRIEAPIGRHPVRRQRMAVVESPNARPAVTEYRVLRRYLDISLVEAKLLTGRTHQIRVHFFHFGHPLVGDPIYGGRQRARLRELPCPVNTLIQELRGQALHAYFLCFTHPRTGRELNFFTQPPEEMLRLLRQVEEVSKN